MPVTRVSSSSFSSSSPFARRALSVMLSALLGGGAVQSAWAQSAATRDERVQHFRIPAGSLGSSLARLALDAGLNLSFDPALTAGRESAALEGDFMPSTALAILLKGSGLVAFSRNDGSINLRKQEEAGAGGGAEPVLKAVTVVATNLGEGGEARAYSSSSARLGALGEKALKDTPYSLEVFSRDLIDNKQAQSLAEATKGDASIALSGSNLTGENNAFAVRGIAPDFYTGQRIDGMATRSRAADLPLENFDRVEILKGASAFQYGFGAPGGVVNYVLKRPTEETLRRIGTQVMDSGLLGVQGDFGGRFGAERQLGYRVAAVREEGDTYIKGGRSKRESASLAADWRIRQDLTWRADMLVAQHARYGGYWALVPNANGVANNYTAASPLSPIDGSRRLAPSFTRYGSVHQGWGTDLGWQLNPDWRAELAYRRAINGREFNAPAIFTDAQGNYSMRIWNYANRFESNQTQASVQGRFATGLLRHELVAGYSMTSTTSFNSPTQSSLLAGGSLSNPADPGNPYSSHVSYHDARTEYDKVFRRELFASDTLHAGDAVDFILGARHGRLEDRYTGYDRAALTPSVAAVYRPLAWLSTYASYVEALEEGGTAPTTAANAGQVFDPLKSTQHELGLKAEGRDWTANASVFRLQRGLTMTSSTNVYSQDGEAHYQGVELGLKTRLGRQWLLGSTAMWLDAKAQKTSSSALDGKHIQGVARTQLSQYAEYRVSGLPLTLTAGARYIGKRPIDAANNWSVGAVTLFDAGARYETELQGYPTVFRLNVDNLANKAYWITIPTYSYLQQGAPRTVKLSMQLDF
ncbi:TonB-dependent siderophore receptor [Uliginosibacterium paludis]|uniref:TonB-dependent receptor n=1 Tax=Uliginosibacterium paludis TaxID=1615952 RepID=A0ABV2CU22_9RHOO